jgi:hypothetical protein
VLSWAAIALYYSNGFLTRLFYGAQSRVMDGTLARANCLLITTLWSAFRFVMVLAVVMAVSSTFFELFSPRGTDDFTMATANALLCWAFAGLVF